MDEIAPEYDIVVLGTGKQTHLDLLLDHTDSSVGLTECVLSGYGCHRMIHEVSWALTLHYSVLSVKGKKVLHIDRNDHYGGSVRPFRIRRPIADTQQ